ncbi:MAG: enolase C-terminal domain-like protein [Gammaproteobacteria bacterium]
MPAPLIAGLTARAVLVPFRHPPVAAAGAIETAPLVLVDLETDAGVTGHAYLMAYSPSMQTPTVACVDVLSELVVGQPLDPAALLAATRARLRLHDTHGLLGQALAGLDMAAWDAHAKAAEMPLARLLGAALDPVPAYNSCGLWLKSAELLADEALALLDEGGFEAVKLRLGRADPEADRQAVAAVRTALPDDAHLMSDFNQSQTVASAIERARMLDGLGLYWFEEPVEHDDYRGAAEVAAAVKTPVQLGENLRGPREFAQAIAAGAARYYMPDVQRIGGVGGWLAAAQMAAEHGLPLSSHLFPEFSVHLLAASPTRHWLEYVDWANPVLEHPLEVRDGHALVPDRPGAGITWDEAAVARYRVA